eukprot:3396633-Pleurochrysis_carterae.AAC.1
MQRREFKQVAKCNYSFSHPRPKVSRVQAASPNDLRMMYPLGPSATELNSHVSRVTPEARTSLACVQTLYQDLNLTDHLGWAKAKGVLESKKQGGLAKRMGMHFRFVFSQSQGSLRK